MQIHGGGFKRRIITDQEEWGNITLRSKRRRGWVEAEDYDSEEEELNNNWEARGLRMIDFGHIGPDKGDLCVECKYRHGHPEHHWIKVRDNYRNYDRPPFLKPKTTQQEFYSEGLKGLTIAISQEVVVSGGCHKVPRWSNPRIHHQFSSLCVSGTQPSKVRSL